MSTGNPGTGYTIAAPHRTVVRDIHLPLLARLQLHDPAEKPRGAARLKRKFAQAAAGLVHGALRVPSHGAFEIEVTGEPRRFSFDARQSAYMAFASREQFGGYEPLESRFLDAMLARANSFHDIGANWGYYTLLAATHPGFDGPVLAFEIGADMSAALERMVAELGLARVTVAGVGLSDRAGTVAITSGDAAHLTQVVSEASAGTREARVDTLDELVAAGGPPPDLIKMDVEGHEPAVLQGGAETLRAHRPLVFFECWEGAAGGAAGAYLRDAGYALYALSDDPAQPDTIALTPADPADPSTEAVNLVAVAAGDEDRWFG